MSHAKQILNHLTNAPITALEALHEYQCFRLAARINDLRMEGHQIHTETIEKNGKRYAQYHLIKREVSNDL